MWSPGTLDFKSICSLSLTFSLLFKHLSNWSPQKTNDGSIIEYLTISCTHVLVDIHFCWNSSRCVARRKDDLMNPLSTRASEAILRGLMMFQLDGWTADTILCPTMKPEHRQTDSIALKMSPIGGILIVSNFFLFLSPATRNCMPLPCRMGGSALPPHSVYNVHTCKSYVHLYVQYRFYSDIR